MSTMDGPENLLRSRGISVDEARGMDIMMVNAWRPFSWCAPAGACTAPTLPQTYRFGLHPYSL